MTVVEARAYIYAYVILLSFVIEGNGDPEFISSTMDYGLLQINKANIVGNGLGSENQLAGFKRVHNIMRKALADPSTDEELFLGAYNTGPNADKTRMRKIGVDRMEKMTEARKDLGIGSSFDYFSVLNEINSIIKLEDITMLNGKHVYVPYWR